MGNCGSSRQEKEDINVEKIFCGSYFSRKPFKKKKKKKNKLSKKTYNGTEYRKRLRTNIIQD
tara:strand:+ start:358 stop:543 length:186 start_codon:yes stop_codon:yes gene_type:complete